MIFSAMSLQQSTVIIFVEELSEKFIALLVNKHIVIILWPSPWTKFVSLSIQACNLKVESESKFMQVTMCDQIDNLIISCQQKC